MSERAARLQSDAVVQIYEFQYTYHDTKSYNGIPGTRISAKCAQYGDQFE